MTQPLTPLQRLGRYLTGEHGKSVATQSAYLADAALLLRFAQTTPLANLTPLEIRGFVRQMRQQGHDARSIARRLSAWRSWYKLLMREESAIYRSNPVASVKAPRIAQTLPRPVSTDAAIGFLDHLNHDTPIALRDRAMFELIYSSGLRVSEVVAVNLTDFANNGRDLLVHGKGGKQRRVPVGEMAHATIQRWQLARATLPTKPDEPALFVNIHGKRLTPRSVQLRLAHWAKQLGLADKLHPHRLRHACASHFLQSSGDLRATQELLGHSSIASTQIYTHLDFQRLAQVYDAAHPRAHKK